MNPLRLLRLALVALLSVLAASFLLLSSHAQAQNLSVTTGGNVCLANITQINPLFPEADLTSVIFFNGNFVAVSNNGINQSTTTPTLYSSDGINWIQAGPHGPNRANGLAVNSTEIIAAGMSAYHSADGINWTNSGLISSGGNTMYGITWTGNEWIAVGDVNEIDTSLDGITWINRLSIPVTNPVHPSLKAVIATTSAYVAVGSNNTIFTSSDSINWLSRPSGVASVTVTFTGLAYDPNPGSQILVAVASSGVIITSTDQGTTWTTVPGAPSIAWQNVRWFENLGLFAAVGASESIATSPDGIHWTMATTDTTPAISSKLYALSDVAVNLAGTLAVSVGAATTIFHSPDASNWLQQYEGVYPDLHPAQSGQIFGNFTDIASDGNLTLVEIAGSRVTNDSSLVAFSKDGGATFGVSAMSQVNTRTPVTFNPTAIAYSPTLGAYVAVGQDNSVQRSTDGGRSWQIVLQYNAANRQEPPFNGITWTGNEFVAVGNLPVGTHQSLGNIQSSSDGITWMSTGIGVSPANMNAVTSNGSGQVVAVGPGGLIAFTSNIDITPMAPWVGEIVNGAQNLTGVAYGNGTWVVVGANGTVFTSNDLPTPDGTLHWTPQSLGGVTANLTSVIYTGGFFFIFDAFGNIYQSLDAVSWTRCTGPEPFGVALKKAAVSALGLNILSAAGNTFLGQVIPPASPAVTAQPGNQTVISGQTATFFATFSGSPTPALQWQQSTDTGVTWSNLTDAGNISGSATTSLTISNTTFLMSGTEYRLVAINSLGSLTGNACILTVNPLTPNITSPPGNQTVTAGQSAQFTVAANGDPTPDYQWQVSTNNGTTWANLTDSGNISGSATSTLTVSNATFAQNLNQFRALAMNLDGTVTSPSATLTVQTLPAFLTQPGNQTVSVGQTASFSVAASGNPTPAYLWQVSNNGGLTWANLTDGNGVTGSATAKLSIANTNLGMSQRKFRALATNVIGSIPSNPATLIVISQPAIISTSSTNPVGIAGHKLTLSVTAGGSPPLKYQWQFDDRNISGATSSTYTITGVKTSNAGKYDVIVTNTSGKVTSPTIILTVLIPVSLTTEPKPVTVKSGATAKFTITATGSKPLTYQWTFNGGTPKASNISGATTRTLTITHATSANAGPYLVLVTNPAGSLPSSSVTLTVK